MSHQGFKHHDHGACISSAMSAAETYCASQKLQFTPVRRRVLEILLSQHKAMGAYDILAQLAQEGLGSQPPVVYRALDFLVSNGFAHKVEKLNAYMACSHPGVHHSPAIMICRACNAVSESSWEPVSAFRRVADEVGFKIERMVVEAEGRRPACQQKEGAA
jgi:Fur family zinc uptake transcriptional regulator